MRSATITDLRVTLLVALCAGLLSAQEKIASPDKTLYAIGERGRKIGKGEEIERFSIFNSQGRLVSVLHVWLTQPDGLVRVGTRGCGSSGWIDSRRFFCKGYINASTGVYLWFDAKTGKELGEAIGSNFTWSPDGRVLANFGNVPHSSNVDEKSDSLEVGRMTWPPESDGANEQHWFRSDLSWSPDSKCVAVVDHQRRRNKAFFLEIFDPGAGHATEHKLQWAEKADEWYPEHDFKINWTSSQVIVHRAGVSQAFGR